IQCVLDPRALPTELLGLDLALGGGIPRGRLTELAGPPYSGKRTLASWLVRATQRIGGWAAYLDAAHSADFDRLHRWGVNLRELLIALPRSLPEALELARLLLLADALDLVVLDLPPHWATRSELERGLRQLRPLLRARPTALVVVRDRASGPGLAAAQLRLRLEPLAQLVLPNPSGSTMLPSGLRVRIHVERSHRWPLCEPPVPIELSEREGVRLALERIDLALAGGIVVQHPLGLIFAHTVLGRSREAAAARLASDPALWSQLEEELRARWLSLARPLTKCLAR
ncbi:MAG: recombinase A, partial [Thermomicrobium sp.]